MSSQPKNYDFCLRTPQKQKTMPFSLSLPRHPPRVLLCHYKEGFFRGRWGGGGLQQIAGRNQIWACASEELTTVTSHMTLRLIDSLIDLYGLGFRVSGLGFRDIYIYVCVCIYIYINGCKVPNYLMPYPEPAKMIFYRFKGPCSTLSPKTPNSKP